jgi:hypothetical protein
VQNSGSDPGQEWLDTEDADDPLQIIGQNVQAHLSRRGLEPSRQEVSGAHPAFERAEDMFPGVRRSEALSALAGYLITHDASLPGT